MARTEGIWGIGKDLEGSGPHLIAMIRICLNGLQKTTEFLSQNNQCPRQPRTQHFPNTNNNIIAFITRPTGVCNKAVVYYMKLLLLTFFNFTYSLRCFSVPLKMASSTTRGMRTPGLSPPALDCRQLFQARFQSKCLKGNSKKFRIQNINFRPSTFPPVEMMWESGHTARSWQEYPQPQLGPRIMRHPISSQTNVKGQAADPHLLVVCFEANCRSRFEKWVWIQIIM
jgi:hypothetical protein